MDVENAVSKRYPNRIGDPSQPFNFLATLRIPHRRQNPASPSPNLASPSSKPSLTVLTLPLPIHLASPLPIHFARDGLLASARDGLAHWRYTTVQLVGHSRRFSPSSTVRDASVLRRPFALSATLPAMLQSFRQCFNLFIGIFYFFLLMRLTFISSFF